jgi:hypothetical protein
MAWVFTVSDVTQGKRCQLGDGGVLLDDVHYDQRDPFAHWPSLGRDKPGITIADDLSNLDDVVRLIQGG